MGHTDRVERFRALHEERPLVLPNAWDAASARVLELAGASAVGTTSAGVSWTEGRRDGERMDRDAMIRCVRRIVDAVDVPVTADVESGYGTGSPPDVAETARTAIDAGAVGINLEDSPGRRGEPLLRPEEHAERIRAAREAALAAGADLVINARTDVYLGGVGEPESRLERTVGRAEAYRQAGADCIFVPGVVDAGTIEALVRAIDAPVNVMAGPDTPSVAELGRLGVARVSVGPGLALAALGAVRRAARALLEDGSFHALGEGLAFGDVEAMFRDTDAA
ncbi:MAG: isocitrate lyase/PEP mutase family protein [Gemmatimonadota bacterium]